MLELQSFLSCGVSQSFDTTMIFATTAVKNYSCYFGSFGFAGYFSTNPSGFFGHGTFGGFVANGGHGYQGCVFSVVYNLGAYVATTDVHAQAWAFSGTGDYAADAVFA
jgi:hypothetical protein